MVNRPLAGLPPHFLLAPQKAAAHSLREPEEKRGFSPFLWIYPAKRRAPRPPLDSCGKPALRPLYHRISHLRRKRRRRIPLRGTVGKAPQCSGWGHSPQTPTLVLRAEGERHRAPGRLSSALEPKPFRWWPNCVSSRFTYGDALTRFSPGSRRECAASFCGAREKCDGKSGLKAGLQHQTA